MKTKNIKNHHLGIVLLVCLMCFSFASPSVAQKKSQRKTASKKNVKKNKVQTTKYQKIDYIIFLKKDSLEKEETKSKIVNVFAKCPLQQQKDILAYMVQAITDSLNANNKQSAIDCIDNYRMLASPDDEYLGSLVVTQGKYYYDKMDAAKLYELQNYLDDISTMSKLDYSSEIAEIASLYNVVLRSREDMLGTWLMIPNENYKFSSPVEVIKITKDEKNQYQVSFEECTLSSSMINKGSIGAVLAGGMLGSLREFAGGVADTCYFTGPKELFYFASSESLRKGKEMLAAGMRGTVRGAGNAVIGQLARGANFSQELFGWFGVIGVEIIFNCIIDQLSLSRKTWILRESYINWIDNSHMSVRFTYLRYKMTSKSATLPPPHITEDNSILYRYPEKCDIVFIDEARNLISDHVLPPEERKAYLKAHPDVKTASNSKKKRKEYNQMQWEKLKEYNRNYDGSNL